MFESIKKLFTTQKAIVTVKGDNYEEDLSYLKYNLEGRQSGNEYQEGDNLEPIELSKFEVLEKKSFKSKN